MTANDKHKPAASITGDERDIHKDWQLLYDTSTSGQKSWMRQVKNHYAKIIQTDPQAAAELLAMYEQRFALIRKYGFVEEKEK